MANQGSKDQGSRSTRPLLWSLVFTGLIIYVVAFLRSLGAIPQTLASAFPFFSGQDAFADYFKLLVSYPGDGPMPPGGWLPAWMRQAIAPYLLSTPYSHDPADASLSLTHFHSPPGATLIYAALRHCSDLISAGGSFVLAWGLILGLLVALTALASRQRPLSRAVLTTAGLCAVSYPSLFAFSRGHILSWLGSLLVMASWLMVLRGDRNLARAIAPLSLAIWIRPNYILLLPLLLILQGRRQPQQKLIPNLLRALAVVLATGLICLVLSRWLYPDYSLDLFVKAYHYYTTMWELNGAGGGSDYSSSLLQPVLILGTQLQSLLGVPMLSKPLLRYLCLAPGLLVCLSSYWRLQRRSGAEASCLLLCILGMILATPLFSDYHLTILIAPLFCALAQTSPVNDNAAPEAMASAAPLSALDGLLIALLMTGKAIPLPTLATGSLQTFLNPLLILGYLVIRTRRLRPVARLAAIQPPE